MYPSTLLTTASLLFIVLASPTEVIPRQTSTTPIATAPLLLGACLAIGTCYTNGDQNGCLSAGCANTTMLGSVCSCNADVQGEIAVQSAKGRKMWPVKCPYAV